MKDKEVLIVIDEANGQDFGCEVSYRILSNGKLEIVNIKYTPPVK